MTCKPLDADIALQTSIATPCFYVQLSHDFCDEYFCRLFAQRTTCLLCVCSGYMWPFKRMLRRAY